MEKKTKKPATKKTAKKVGAKASPKKKKITSKKPVKKTAPSLPAPPRVPAKIPQQKTIPPTSLIALPETHQEITGASASSLSNLQSTSMPVVNTVTVGRNAPCPCGSGKKYKKCCLK